MSTIAVTTPFNIDLEFQTAPFGKRVAAWVVDLVVICLYYYLMMRFVVNTFDKSDELSSSGNLLLVTLPVFFYHPLMEVFFNGQSLGKKIIGIKVIDTEGHEPTIGQYITRWILSIGNLFLYLLPYYMIVTPFRAILFLVLYIPDVISVAISSRSQRISDIAAGTVVIDLRHKININDTIYVPVDEDAYVPMFPQVMRLTDRDINSIRNLLEVKSTKDMDTYTDQVAYRIKEVLQIENTVQNGMPSTQFLRQLLKDYNFLTQK